MCVRVFTLALFLIACAWGARLERRRRHWREYCEAVVAGFE